MSARTDLLRAEWTKLRSVRSTFWSLLVLGAAMVGFTALVAGFQASDWNSMSAADRHSLITDPVGNTLVEGALWATLGACVLGVMVMATEYSTGLIRSSVLATPKRTGLLTAKATVFGLATLVVSEISGFIAFFVAKGFLGSHVSMSLSDGRTLAAVASAGPLVTVFGLLAFAIAAIIRHVAGALIISIALTMLVPTMVIGMMGHTGRYINTFLAGGNAPKNVLSTAGDHSDSVLSGWGSFGIECLWVALLIGAASYLLRRRDA
jgi:ABC-2 type transport system permease protein